MWTAIKSSERWLIFFPLSFFRIPPTPESRPLISSRSSNYIFYLALRVARDDDITHNSHFEHAVFVLVQLFDDDGFFNVPDDYIATRCPSVQVIAFDRDAADVTLLGVQLADGLQIVRLPYLESSWMKLCRYTTLI